MENWETDANIIKKRHFEFPSGFWRIMALDAIPAYAACRPNYAKATTERTLVLESRQPIIRRYKAEPAALEKLVDALYELLLDTSAESPCIPAAQE